MPIVLRKSIAKLTPESPNADAVVINTESTMAIEGFHRALALSYLNNPATAKAAADVSRTTVEAIHNAVDSYLTTELNNQGTTVNITDPYQSYSAHNYLSMHHLDAPRLFNCRNSVALIRLRSFCAAG